MCVLCVQLWIFNAVGSFCPWTIQVWWMLPCRDLSKKQSLPYFLSNFTYTVTLCAVCVSCYPQCSGERCDPPRSCLAIPGPSNIPGNPGVDQLWTQYLKLDFKGLNVHLACLIFFFISRSSVTHLLACPHREALWLSFLNWIMAICHLSLAGNTVKCQNRSSRVEVFYSACGGHLLLSAGSCRERTFVWPFLYCRVPGMGSQLKSGFVYFSITGVFTLFNTSKIIQKPAWLWHVSLGSLSSCADLFLCMLPLNDQWDKSGDSASGNLWLTDDTAAEMDFLGKRD